MRSSFSCLFGPSHISLPFSCIFTYEGSAESSFPMWMADQGAILTVSVNRYSHILLQFEVACNLLRQSLCFVQNLKFVGFCVGELYICCLKKGVTYSWNAIYCVDPFALSKFKVCWVLCRSELYICCLKKSVRKLWDMVSVASFAHCSL